MKTSNLILITLAALPVFFVATILFTFQWKMAQGHHVVIDSADNYDYKQFAFRDINYVVLKDLNCVIVPSDSIQIDVERANIHLLNLKQNHDTLIVYPNSFNSAPKIRLHLPTLNQIAADNCEILLRGKFQSTGRKSYNFQFRKTSLRTDNISDEERIPQYIDSVFVTGSDSFIDLSGTLQIRKMVITDIRTVKRNPRVNVDETVFVYNNKSEVKSTGKNGIIEIVAKN